MAIEFTKEKQPLNIMGILVAIVVVAAVFVGAYFLLFTRPEFIEVVLPAPLQLNEEISTIDFEPRRVFESEKFKVLRQYGGGIIVPSAGKSNPFLP
jgi:hypothetical protein